MLVRRFSCARAGVRELPAALRRMVNLQMCEREREREGESADARKACAATSTSCARCPTFPRLLRWWSEHILPTPFAPPLPESVSLIAKGCTATTTSSPGLTSSCCPRTWSCADPGCPYSLAVLLTTVVQAELLQQRASRTSRTVVVGSTARVRSEVTGACVCVTILVDRLNCARNKIKALPDLSRVPSLRA